MARGCRFDAMVQQCVLRPLVALGAGAAGALKSGAALGAALEMTLIRGGSSERPYLNPPFRSMIFALKPFTKDCSLTRLITRGYFVLNISNTFWLKTIAIRKYHFMDDFLPTTIPVRYVKQPEDQPGSCSFVER